MQDDNQKAIAAVLASDWRPPSIREMAAVLADVVRHLPRTSSDVEILQALVDARPEGLPFNGSARRNWKLVEVLQLAAQTTTDGQCCALGLARWAQGGRPTVVMPATYAAALCATATHAEQLAKVSSPMSAFVIDVADGLLPVDNPSGPDFVTRILVFRHEHRLHDELAWAYMAWTKLTLTLWRFGVDAPSLLPADIVSRPEVIELASFPLAITDLDRRTSTMIGRLIVNTCLAMTDPANVKVKASVHHVGRRLEVDLREEVKAYCRGETRKSPEIGGWVSSHWKTQPYGPAKSLRKWIFVEPYWRGPEGSIAYGF